ncbi:HigA family addiction module antitoxin [Pseudomonas luteola]
MNSHIGSDFDDFLRDEGLLETCSPVANERLASMLHNIHPGEILREEFMMPLGLSAPLMAAATGLQLGIIEGLCNEQQAITPAIAASLSFHLGTSIEFWLNLQALFDACDRDKNKD